MAKHQERELEALDHRPARSSRGTTYFQQNIDTFLTSIPILLCCFTSGVIDAGVFNAWGVFASMQTGKASNTGNLIATNPDANRNRKHCHSSTWRITSTCWTSSYLALNTYSYCILFSRKFLCWTDRTMAITPSTLNNDSFILHTNYPHCYPCSTGPERDSPRSSH